ncbi:MAG: DUF2946 family protein [Rhodocyclales bacterium]|nr:DUF2946 family protein [Rhodocyclales bacterium]
MLLALGLLAMALHLVAGSAMARAAAAQGGKGGFVTELCTSHGVVRLDLGQSGGKSPAGEFHDCCTLCAAGAPLLAAGHGSAVAPAPTFHATQDWRRFAPRLPAPLAFHAPRGPPGTA